MLFLCLIFFNAFHRLLDRKFSSRFFLTILHATGNPIFLLFYRNFSAVNFCFRQRSTLVENFCDWQVYIWEHVERFWTLLRTTFCRLRVLRVKIFSSTRNCEIKRNGKSINEQSLSWPSQRLKNVLYCSGKLASSLNLVKHILDSIWPYRTKVSLVVSDWSPMENSTMSDYLICNENREFLYENEGIPGINPDFVYDLKRQTDHSKMANDFAETTRIVPNQQTSTPTRKRKRNSVKDRMRAEAEQTAYKKLKELIPSLRGHKRITKLQTIREACLYIQNLQKTLTGIRKG